MELESIINGCKHEDRTAMECFYYRFAPQIKGICYRYAPHTEEAEDMFHDVLIDLFRKIRQYNGRAPFEPWLRRVVLNSVIDYGKRRQRDRKKLEEAAAFFYGEAGAAGPDETDDIDAIKAALTAEDLLLMIRELPSGFRTVFNLYAIDGYAHREIAKMLNISEGTSKSQLSRAKAFLRKEIEKKSKFLQSGERTR